MEYHKLEKWKDGSLMYVERDFKGHFIKIKDIGIWNNEGFYIFEKKFGLTVILPIFKGDKDLIKRLENYGD